MSTPFQLQTVGNYTWYLDYDLTQSVEDNQSTIDYTLRAHRNVSAGSGAFWGTPARTFNVTLDGNSDSENVASVDFRDYADKNFVTGTVVVDHLADGTHADVRVYASSSGTAVSTGFPVPATYGYATGHTDLKLALPTIDRNLVKLGVDGVYKNALVYVGAGGVYVPHQVKVGVDGIYELVGA